MVEGRRRRDEMVVWERWGCPGDGNRRKPGCNFLLERANAGDSQPDVRDERDPWRLHNDAATSYKCDAPITVRCCWSLG